MAPLARTAARPGQLAQQFGVSEEQPPEQRPAHDGEKVGACQAVEPPSARVVQQGLDQLLERLEPLPFEDRPEELVAGLPVQVDGALGDVVDGDAPVAVAEQELGGDVENPRSARRTVARIVESVTGPAHATSYDQS